jgi:uncharacterized membrane protein
MKIDEKTAKLMVLFIAMHIVSAALGVVTGIIFGVLAGLVVFTVSIIVLPLLLQYLYLSNRKE